MKVLFCDNSLKELLNFRGDIIEYYTKKNFEVCLVSPFNFQNFNKYPFLDNVKFIPVHIDANGTNPLNDLRYLFKLFRVYRRQKPDYIFHYTIKPNIYGTLAAKLLRIKSTAMVAGLGACFSNNKFGDKLARFLYKLSLKLSDKVLVLNEYNYDYLLSKKYVSPDKLILLPGGEGVNLEKFSQE